MQLHEIVLPCVRRARPDLATLERMSKLKFVRRIAPGDALSLVLRWENASATVDFTLGDERGDRAAGRLFFGGGG